MSREVRATYRVQLHKDFNFDDLAATAPYLAELGVSHVYCSPYFQAGPGSTHGYDVLDPTTLSDELGGADGHARMCAALADAGLGQILDIVPNHMAISSRANRWWWDVLKNGRLSSYATYFDIDWDPPEEKLKYTILMPILGDHYGHVLDRGELRLARDGDELLVVYFDHELPISPTSIHDFFGEQEAVDDAVRRFNSDPDALHELLEAQHYRLAYWRTATRELDYRRFFDINTLVGLRQEEPQVFDATHELVLTLVGSGAVQGLRVDHIDGLRDPAGYLERLRDGCGDAYIVVEKILAAGEDLPQWPVEGTTGYEFLNLVNGLFVDPDGEAPLTDGFERFATETTDVTELVRATKLMVMRELLASDVERLVALFVDVCENNRNFRDYTRYDLREALRETIAALAVYRTYVDASGKDIGDQDIAYVNEAVEIAADRRHDLERDLFFFLRDILLRRIEGDAETELALRFQQVTGSVMAKGVEDTALYVYNRLISLNEVGGEPAKFGTSADEFHAANRERQLSLPRTMLASSTHDTKRSEDVRVRIDLLSEIPELWNETARRWSAANDRYRSDGMPDRNIEYLLYQTLIGAWPLTLERVLAYAQKASKEAKAHTSWIDPLPEFDRALASFVTSIFEDAGFVADLEAFVTGLIDPGWVSSLSQTLLKLTAPGVPDIYQGTDLWDLSLVDPDNRRPVDYAARRSLLASVADASPEELWEQRERGAPKLALIARTLRVRSSFPRAFGSSGSYEALSARGDKADHLVAFCRGGDVVTVVPRLVLGLGEGFGDTTVDLPAGSWRSELTGDDVGGGAEKVSNLLARFPVALLWRLGEHR